MSLKPWSDEGWVPGTRNKVINSPGGRDLGGSVGKEALVHWAGEKHEDEKMVTLFTDDSTKKERKDFRQLPEEKVLPLHKQNSKPFSAWLGTWIPAYSFPHLLFRQTGPVSEIPDAVQSPNPNRKDHPKPVLVRCWASGIVIASDSCGYGYHLHTASLPDSDLDNKCEFTHLCWHCDLTTDWWASQLPAFAWATLPPHWPAPPKSHHASTPAALIIVNYHYLVLVMCQKPC